MQTNKEKFDLITNQMLAERANLLQLTEDQILPLMPKHTLRLLNEAIEKLPKGNCVDIVPPTKVSGSIKLMEKILIPQKDFPYTNFKGSLLGTGGKILRKIQEETESKIMILGAGSMKSAQIEEDLKASGNTMYRHLNDPLHISIISEGPPMIAFTKMGLSLKEITKNFLSTVLDDVPVSDRALVEQICTNLEKTVNGQELEFMWKIS